MSGICPVMVFSILQAGFEIVHVKPEKVEEKEEHETLEPTMSLLPLYHPCQSFPTKYREPAATSLSCMNEKRPACRCYQVVAEDILRSKKTAESSETRSNLYLHLLCEFYGVS